MKEEWRDVTGYEGKYQVSNMGRIISKNYHREGKEYELFQHKSGQYPYVALCDGHGHVKHLKVHRLVAMASVVINGDTSFKKGNGGAHHPATIKIRP